MAWNPRFGLLKVANALIPGCLGRITIALVVNKALRAHEQVSSLQGLIAQLVGGVYQTHRKSPPQKACLSASRMSVQWVHVSRQEVEKHIRHSKASQVREKCTGGLVACRLVVWS